MNKETTTPGITQGEYYTENETTVRLKASNGFDHLICHVGSGLNSYEENASTASLFALAGNLSQKYVSLEAMEKRLIELVEECAVNDYVIKRQAEIYQEQLAEIATLTTENKRLHQELDLRCAHVTAKDDLLKKVEDENRELTNLLRQYGADSKYEDGCSKCENNKSGVEAGLWCINNCVAGSKFKALQTK